MNQEEHQQHQQQRGGNRERRHHRMQQQFFETPPPIAYGYVDTSWEAHVTMLHHLQSQQRYVFFLSTSKVQLCFHSGKGVVQTGV